MSEDAKKVLLATGGALEGQRFPAGGLVLIGREGECNIQILDGNVSRRHACVLEQDDGSFLLRDLRSQNGTFVAGRRVTERVLKEGDEFSVCTSSFQLVEARPAELVNEEAELKLVSGAANHPTTETTLSQRDRDHLQQAAQRSTAQTIRMEAVKVPTCCDSPLASRALAEGWAHCPACGAALG